MNSLVESVRTLASLMRVTEDRSQFPAVAQFTLKEHDSYAYMDAGRRSLYRSDEAPS
jgi:hypothetical protein